MEVIGLIGFIKGKIVTGLSPWSRFRKLIGSSRSLSNYQLLLNSSDMHEWRHYCVHAEKKPIAYNIISAFSKALCGEERQLRE